MHSLLSIRDRSVSAPAATNRHTVAEVVAEAAGLALHHADSAIPASGRRFLSEAKRPDYSIRRAQMFAWWDSFFEWMSYTPREIATHPAEMLRGIVLGYQPAPVPCLPSGIRHENSWNHRADDFERWYLLERTNCRIDGLIHGWGGQLEATRLGLDIAHIARTRQTISLPSA